MAILNRLADLRVVDPLLTKVILGYTDDTFIGTLLAPIVSVEKEAGKFPMFGKEMFRVYETERAIRAKSNEMTPEGIRTMQFLLKEHDLVYPIDYRETQESQLINLQVQGARVTMRSVLRNLELQIAGYAQDTATYNAGNFKTLAGGQCWDDKINSDPVEDVEEGKEAIRMKVGVDPNVMILGAQTYNKLKQHPKLIGKVIYSQVGILNDEILKRIFDIPTLIVGHALKVGDGPLDPSEYIWGDVCILAYVPTSPAQYEPAFAYTLRKSGFPQADRYESENRKIEYIRATDINTSMVVGADAGYLIKNTVL